MALLTNDGAGIAYDDTGQGSPPFALIHDWLSDRSVWSAQVDDLARSYRCLTVDLRDSGESTSEGPVDIDTLADDVANVLQHVALPPAIVVGHGLGGLVAMVLGKRHPSLVRGTVLVDAWLTPVANGALGQLAASVRAAASTDPARTFVQALFGSATPAGLRDGVLERLQHLPWETAAQTLESAAALGPNLDQLLKDTDQKPFMAVWPGSPLGNPDELRYTTVFLRQEPIPGSHYFPVEHPAMTSVLLRAFVDDVERDPRLPDFG